MCFSAVRAGTRQPDERFARRGQTLQPVFPPTKYFLTNKTKPCENFSFHSSNAGDRRLFGGQHASEGIPRGRTFGGCRDDPCDDRCDPVRYRGRRGVCSPMAGRRPDHRRLQGDVLCVRNLRRRQRCRVPSGGPLAARGRTRRSDGLFQGRRRRICGRCRPNGATLPMYAYAADAAPAQGSLGLHFKPLASVLSLTIGERLRRPFRKSRSNRSTPTVWRGTWPYRRPWSIPGRVR